MYVKGNIHSEIAMQNVKFWVGDWVWNFKFNTFSCIFNSVTVYYSCCRNTFRSGCVLYQFSYFIVSFLRAFIFQSNYNAQFWLIFVLGEKLDIPCAVAIFFSMIYCAYVSEILCMPVRKSLLSEEITFSSNLELKSMGELCMGEL